MKDFVRFYRLLLAAAYVSWLLPSPVMAHDIELDGICYNIDVESKKATVTYRGNLSDGYHDYAGDIVIPASISYEGVTYRVTKIGECAFNDCTGLTGISIPSSITAIEGEAFVGCHALTGVDIPSSVTRIGIGAFAGSGLMDVNVPNTVEYIGMHAFHVTPWFENCPDGLIYLGLVAYCYKGTMPDGTSLALKDGTVCVAGDAFGECKGLMNITIPQSVKHIGYRAFSESGLLSVTIPGKVTVIEDDTFNGCTQLTSVTISNSVKEIGASAFAYCTGLESVVLGNSVGDMGRGVFAGCGNLSSVTCYATTAPWTWSDTFDEAHYQQVTLYVPKASLEKYRSASNWKRFSRIVGIDITGDVNGDGEVGIGDINSLIAAILAGKADGVMDVNSDGEVSIADVSALIDIYMKQ